MTRGATFPFGYQVPDPGVGDTDNLRAIATSRTANAEHVGQALAEVRFIAGDIPSHWTGSAAEMNLRATLALVPDLDILKTSYENHASALTTYTAAVERIRTAAAPQIAAYDQALERYFGWRIQRDDIKVGYPVPREYEPIFGAPAGLYDEDDWRRAVILDRYIEGAEETMSGLRGALDGLVADRTTADQICGGTQLGQRA